MQPVKGKPIARKASEGPDIVDVSAFLRELTATHNVTCEFVVKAGAGFYIGCATVILKVSAPVLVGPGKAWSAEIQEAFPGHKHKTIEAVMYYLCHKADALCSKELWRQEAF